MSICHAYVSSLATTFPILNFTSSWLFFIYFYFLIPSPLHLFRHTALPFGSHQNALCIHDSFSVLLLCLICFLDSIVDRYIFIAILLFIVFFLLNYILLIMLLQLCQLFSPLYPLLLYTPTLLHSAPLSSCPWVIHIRSLASPFPILFLTSPCLFCARNCFSYSLYLFPPSPPPTPLLTTLHVISISVVLFLF